MLRWRNRLQGVEEIRAFVTEGFGLFVSHPSGPVVALTSASEAVLAGQKSAHGDASTEEADDHVNHDCGVTALVIRASLVDIGGHNTVEVAPSDDTAENNSTLVDAFDVIANPGDSVRDGRVDSQSAKEGTDILQVWVLEDE